jgi:succinylarginine dihydrolase
MTVRFLRVLGIRSKEPSVLATVDGEIVRWNSRRSSSCSCLDLDAATACPHIELVTDLLDLRVFTPLNTNR